MRRAALAMGCSLMLAVAGCASDQAQKQSSGASPAATPGPAARQAAASFGTQLTAGQFRELVVGNTLFRPLQIGATTVVYVAPDDSLKLRVQTPEGKMTFDRGREVLSSDTVCWLWEHAGKTCFRYYWSGRLITLEDVDNKMLPAQFLIQKGNAEDL